MQDVAAEHHFRNNLAAAMKARRVSQTALAEKIQSSRPYIHNVLRGTYSPGLERCEELANAVGCDLRDMLLPPEIFSETLLTSVP